MLFRPILILLPQNPIHEFKSLNGPSLLGHSNSIRCIMFPWSRSEQRRRAKRAVVASGDKKLEKTFGCLPCVQKIHVGRTWLQETTSRFETSKPLYNIMWQETEATLHCEKKPLIEMKLWWKRLSSFESVLINWVWVNFLHFYSALAAPQCGKREMCCK